MVPSSGMGSNNLSDLQSYILDAGKPVWYLFLKIEKRTGRLQ